MNMENRKLLEQGIQELVIPADNVAHVQVGNSLEHALLVLTRSGYTAVPVLDLHFRIHGLISTPIIFDSILGIERIEHEKLTERKVEEVMNRKVPLLKESDSFLRALELSINNPFICIGKEDGVFAGILTRRSILASVYKNFRNFREKN
ncbi:cyclic-di-AMP-binding protein CbpB [Effusibacillus lacus]|uniref:CBS domain-containing protein n=1 Tax=Effusibacillus lacus TaxID=1348429 RepID=A0A292YLM3_9BACL|nr:cyclic-di-AMP-binding protein CbpB [Effusibacillus lacus]GAX89360.1 CBS domain-containing protein [Effusibacillus lacus]